ncbi:MAG: hypothetical protein J7K72_04985, partial [Candidatus Aenigmarchaeota archaeon]|nr:hypothetical protein [Candidatus Aenigmarchaeota archaeon]
TVSDSCENSCTETCECTECKVDCSPPPTHEYCVEGVCGAECESDNDCKCSGKDGCVGPDYYDYPDHGTCSEDCVCSECEPRVSICDQRCMGNCVVEVTIGHDMNPSWVYPYTATDDIYIIATDVSNGACNGLTIPIFYWQCSCPDAEPEQTAIEYSQIPKYDRLCTYDASEGNPTHSLQCSSCVMKVYRARFPEDNGRKYWTDSGSCQGTFQIDITDYYGCYARKGISALACAGSCEDKPA